MANNETPNNDAPIYPIKNASSSANQQLQSKIMHLPQEVRDEICANIFYSTHFTYAHEGHPIESSAREIGLALLRTCRRARDEIGVSWLHQVLFNFLDPFTLLNKLADLPITLREQIRHVCVSGRELRKVYDEESESSYNTAQILKLLPESCEHLALCSKAWSDATYLDEIHNKFKEPLSNQMKKDVNMKARELAIKVCARHAFIRPALY